MTTGDQNTAASAGAPKFDMRIGPDTDGAALAFYRQSIGLIYNGISPPRLRRAFSSAG